MSMRRVLGFCFVISLSVANLRAAGASELADAAMNGNKEAVRSLLLKKTDVNATQVDWDNSVALGGAHRRSKNHNLLIRAGANVAAAKS